MTVTSHEVTQSQDAHTHAHTHTHTHTHIHIHTHTQGSTLQKVKKSLGTVKDSVVKFAKNE